MPGGAVAVGHFRGTEAGEVGYRSAMQALDELPHGAQPGWALAFCGGRLNEREVLTGARRVLPEIPIVGGAAVGTVVREGASYSGFECAVAVFSADGPQPVILTESFLQGGEARAGRRLGERIRDVRDRGPVMLFYDSVLSADPPRLHVGSVLLDALYASLGDLAIHVFGGGTAADFKLNRGYVFDGENAIEHAAVAVVLPSASRVRTTILHGCVPSSGFLEITRIDGAVVRELDGRPALDVVERMLGTPITPASVAGLSLELTLGRKHGDLFAPYDEGAYVNRLIVNADAEARTLTLFEPDFEVGARVQFMARDNGMMLRSVRRGVDALMREVEGEDPMFALYIDCAGRTCAFSGADTEEAELMVGRCRKDIPVLGFYSGVEIAPLMGRSRPLDWTGVLAVFMR